MATKRGSDTAQLPTDKAQNPMKDFDDVLGDLPEEDRQVMTKMVQFSMQMGGAISPQTELMRKMTPEHISAYLETQKQVNNNEFKESRDRKIFFGVIFVIVAVMVVIIIVLLKENPDILEKILYSVGGLVTGLLGGYGYGKSKRD